MKKLGILLLAAAFAVCGLAVLSSCIRVEVPVHTHSFGEWTIVSEPTCIEEGLRERVCACGEKESEEIEALGHDYKGEVTIEPLCTTDGEMAYICSRCGDSYTETIEALGHMPGEAIKENEVAATCTAGGSYEEVVYCAACGEELSRKNVEVVSLGHDCVKGVCARCGEAEPYTEGLIFELSGDGASYAVTGYKGTSTEVYIPSYYRGLPVTSIGDYAFAMQDWLTSIMIGDGVILIGRSAFILCDNLTSVIIGDNVTSIGECAFSGCSSLANIMISDSVSCISNFAFEGCRSLTSVIIGDNVTSIGECAFYDCDSLMDIMIPDSVTSIGDYAFYGCSSLTSITIPNSVMSIGRSTFSKCDSLTSVTIGDGVTSIGEGVFGGCGRLTNISVDPQNSVYHSTGSHLIETKSKSLIAMCMGSMIPTDGSVTSIGRGAFKDCTWLEHIVLPDSLTSIGNSAFENCDRLKNITISDSVTSIGDYAFSGCSNLTSVIIGDGVTSIGSGAFQSCGSLIDVTIGDGVEVIGFQTFYNCSSLISIVIPDSVGLISNFAFLGCDCLTSAVFECPEGWWCVEEGMVDPEALSNSEIAAEYLTDRYLNLVWMKR